jgi:hypothetical protein
MKKLLLAAGAALGVFFIVEKIKANKTTHKTEDGVIANMNEMRDEVDYPTNEITTPAINDDREILEDGGNEMGSTAG